MEPNISSAPMTDQLLSASSRSLDEFCRVCLLRRVHLLPLMSEYNGVMIPEMLWKVSGTLLNVLEQLPRVICERCLTKLDLAYNIAQEFRKQEELLRSFCWKGALVDQLDGFQQTEDAGKISYSEMVLQKLSTSTSRVTPADIEKETLEKQPEPAVEESPLAEVTELLVEQLDDLIEVERFDEEIHSEGDQFEMIVEENSIDSRDAQQESTHAENRFDQTDESQSSVVTVKKEVDDEEIPKGKADTEMLSVLITKVEEEWIDDEEKSWEELDPKATELEESAAASCVETDESQDPIWFDENTCEAEDDDEELQKPRQKKTTKMRKTKRVIKSVTNADGLFECKICGKTFSVQKTFLNHLRRHEHVQKGSFHCKKCDKVFGTKHRLSRHETIHTRTLVCKECDKEFKYVHELRSHEAIHLKGKQKCRSCDFVCYTRHDMKVHRSTSECGQSDLQNAPVKPPVLKDKKCPFEGCDYVAQTYGAMYVHKRTKHQAMYECDLCDKKFAFANQLKQHETVHTGEKPFQCDICSKMFRRLFSYKEHMAIHEGDGRYECGICGKVFARPRYLSAHVTTHSEDRPFECTMCGSNYKSNGELTKHIRAKHESLEYGNGNDLIEEDYNYFEDEIYL